MLEHETGSQPPNTDYIQHAMVHAALDGKEVKLQEQLLQKQSLLQE